MRPWSRNETTGVEVNGTTQFEGRTAEEAVARAKAALGDSGTVRCWKTRRGGVGGFFAKEVFVASLTPPPGSEATRRWASRARPGKADSAAGADGAPDLDAAPAGRAGATNLDDGLRSGDLLSDLVEATADQVSLQSLAIPADAFDQVLAEAEAALAPDPQTGVSLPRDPAASAAQAIESEGAEITEATTFPPGTDSPGSGEPSLPPAAAVPPPAPSARRVPAPAKNKTIRTKPTVRSDASPSRPAPAVKPVPRQRPARMPDLKAGLRSLGVPDSYLPRGRCPSLDTLTDMMATLPIPPALPATRGAAVAVIGTGPNLARTVDLVIDDLSLGRRDVRYLAASPGASRDLRNAENVRLGRQVARRRSSGSASLVVIDAEPGISSPADVQALLELVAADYVLAAVGAECKRADVEHRLGAPLTVDAVALWDLSRTRTPGEMLGLLPIAFVDGAVTSPVGWTLALAGRAVALRP
jgi:hypothetical protein